MKKRLFIGIPLPQEILQKVEKLERKVDSRLPWLPIENLHLTLVFLGWQEKSEVQKISMLMKNIKQPAFKLKITKVDYSPNARMLWLFLSVSAQLKNLQTQLHNLLQQQEVVFEKERHEYLPHINLIRLKEAYRKNIKQALDWKLGVKKVNLYESILGKPSTKYEILKSVRLL